MKNLIYVSISIIALFGIITYSTLFANRVTENNSAKKAQQPISVSAANAQKTDRGTKTSLDNAGISVQSDGIDWAIADPVIQPNLRADELIEMVDPTKSDERKFAELTAHMSGKELANYRILKNFPIVRTFDGKLNDPYEWEECSISVSDDCKRLIVNMKTRELVFDGKEWASGYVESKAGLEVRYSG